MYQNWTLKKVYAAKMKKSVFGIWEKSLYCLHLYGVRLMVYALW